MTFGSFEEFDKEFIAALAFWTRLGMPKRVVLCLAYAGIRTVEKLNATPDKVLRSIPNFGRASLKIVRKLKPPEVPAPFVFDAWKGKNSDELRDDCRRLSRSLVHWQCIALDLADGRKLTDEDQDMIDNLCAAFERSSGGDNDDT